jgi:L(+)-tartrate dehydratase beta subunit
LTAAENTSTVTPEGEARLRAPVDETGLAPLRIGQVVYLDGVIYTGREALYDWALQKKKPLPVDLADVSNVNFHCSPAATVTDDGAYRVGAVTATASFRFERYLEDWLPLSKAKVIIGKGGMPPAAYRDVFVPNGAVYLTTVGYGTGALLGRGIRAVRDVYLLEQFGIAQAVWVLEVEHFGPFIVESDLTGASLFEEQNAAIDRSVQELYRGLPPPALSRYGETSCRTDELI